MTSTATTIALREPDDADWPAILRLANQSVAGVLGAGPQDGWLQNRRRPREIRRHFVATSPRGEVIGYGAVESEFAQAEGGFRLFVVTTPDLLDGVGSLLCERAFSILAELRAREAWFIEYAADEPFIALVRPLGFHPARRFRLESGVEGIVLTKRLADV